jgi:tetratricopeptide (TPR) repeat protein
VAGDAFLRSATRAGADSAAAAYGQALVLAPALPLAAAHQARAMALGLERGGAAWSQGRGGTMGRAMDLVESALAGDSTLASAWTARAILSRLTDPVRFEGAVAAHRRAIQLAPGDAEAEHEYGVTLMRLGNATEARTHFQRALDLEPSRPSTLAALAEMEHRAGRAEAACVLSNAAIAAWPFDPLPYAVRALSRLQLAETRDAFSDAEVAARLVGGAWPAALRILVTNGASDVARARQLATAMTAAWLAPGDALTVRDAEYMALAYLSSGDRRRALVTLRRARPVGADLALALGGSGFASIRTDTAFVRMLRESRSGGAGDGIR